MPPSLPRLLAGCLVAAALATATAAMAGPRSLTPDELIDFCLSPTLARAEQIGEGLGWHRMTEADVAEWRSGFNRAFPGTSVNVVGWRRGGRGEGQVSFWIARGPVSHRACTYLAGEAGGLAEALSARFGAPDADNRTDGGRSAFWQRGKMQAAFSHSGSAVYVNISQAD